MGDWPGFVLPPPPILTPYNIDSLGVAAPAIAAPLSGAASGTWPTSNKAYFYPFMLSEWATAYQLLFYVGATSGNNIDVGIYDSQKNLVVSSGSTAMSATTNTWQELNITDTSLPPGEYLLAASCNGTTGTVFRQAGSDEIILPSMPVYEQTSAFALPDPCTPVICTDTTPFRMAIGIQLFSTF